MQASKIACHNFMDAGRRHKIPTSETKDFITHDMANSRNIRLFVEKKDFITHDMANSRNIRLFVPVPQAKNSHMTMRRGPSDTCTWGGLLYRKV